MPFHPERECVSSIVYASLQSLNVALISHAINIGGGAKDQKIFPFFFLVAKSYYLFANRSNVHHMLLVSQMP